MEETSITSLKAGFIRSQVRHLETPLEPSTQWRDLLPESDQGQLSDKTINDLVAKVNEKIRQHNRLIFSSQSQRHVAEQVESLHWNLVSEDTERAEIDTVVIRKDQELAETRQIQSLPEDYDDLHLHPDHERQEDEAQRYTRLREELLEVSARRDMLKKKLTQYEHLKKLMQPLDDPQKNIQPNLTSRDGELSQELDRMRVLLARITGRVGDVDKSVNARTEKQRTLPQADQQKLARVLGLG